MGTTGRFIQRLGSISGLMAAMAGAGCNLSDGQETCATNTYDDVGNLKYGILGTVVDQYLVPIAGAKVFIPGTSVEKISDANGRFAIAAADVGNATSVQLWAELEGYPDKVLTVPVPSDHVADAALVMKPFDHTDEITADQGGTVENADAAVSFPPGSLAYMDTGEVVTGKVEVSFITYRPDNEDELAAAPGSLDGVMVARDVEGNVILDSEGNPTYTSEPLRTLGMIDVTMWQEGRRLELIPGSPASVQLKDFAQGDIDEEAIAAATEELAGQLSGPIIPVAPMWHFNYDEGNWDLVDNHYWTLEDGAEGGYLNMSGEVPEFSAANVDYPRPVCIATGILVVSPSETCVCKHVEHANNVEPVRGASMTVFSTAPTRIYVEITCVTGRQVTTTTRQIGQVMSSSLTRATTNQNGDFCATALVDAQTLTGSARIGAVKTYWPGELDEEDLQYKDVDNDGSFDDDGDGEIDPENIIGFLGDTHRDRWTVPLSGTRVCGAPDGDLPVECINEPVNPLTGQQPQ